MDKTDMSQLQRTVLFDRHVAAGAKIVDFAGWEMPIQYAGGIVEEHLATRKRAGLFDVSHMGRFVFSGPSAKAFLQHVPDQQCRRAERRPGAVHDDPQRLRRGCR